MKNGTLLSIYDGKTTTLGRDISKKTEIEKTIGRVEIKEKIIDVRCGNRHVLALTICGRVYSWGEPNAPQVTIFYLFKVGFGIHNDESENTKPRKIKVFEVISFFYKIH